MTETLHRPPTTRSSEARRPDPLRAGVPAALWAFLAGLVTVAVPVLVGWAADSRSASSASAALAAVGQVFLVAHGSALSIPGGHLDLLPLGLTLVPFLLLARAGRHAATVHPSESLKDGARLTVAIAFPYATLAAVLAAASGTDDVRPAPVQSLVGAGVLALVAGGFGVVRGAGLWPGLVRSLPERAVVIGRGAVAALVGLLGAGALLAGVSLALHAGRATDLADATGPGVVGALLLLAIGVGLAPVAAVWGACWWVGPGFSVGTGTAVGPFDTELGAVPAVPLLAALPTGPLPPWLGVLALLVPLGLGALAGVVVRRHDGSWVDALLVGPVVGLALAVLAVLTAGPAGGERLAHVGPTSWQVGLACAVEVAVGAVALVAGRAWWDRRAA